jgi:hypothetical protein
MKSLVPQQPTATRLNTVGRMAGEGGMRFEISMAKRTGRARGFAVSC